MTFQHPAKAQRLPLPFQPCPIARLTEEDRTVVLSALVQLLLAAAGADLKEAGNEC
ncbi:hypothetical protein [Pseudoruegeria sp. HB172150]|uniref:hypothetical protein n=1 Tax=Pseudoruegeria sp. HB172150 TaxID=2721164 RepID=UPI001552C60E|nr:hypothetical protein [Pseudoruegeria sp. HB172150]